MYSYHQATCFTIRQKNLLFRLCTEFNCSIRFVRQSRNSKGKLFHVYDIIPNFNGGQPKKVAFRHNELKFDPIYSS